MTIIVMGHLRMAKGEIDRLAGALSAMMARSNEEAGCEHYSFARHLDDPDTLIVSERWATAEALTAHGASAHMDEFNKSLGSAKVEDISIKVWTGDYLRTLAGS